MKKGPHIVFLGILAVVFIAVPLLTLKGAHNKVSFYEQRSLAPLPAASLEALLDGSYFGDIDTFLSDHFGGRDRILKADTYLNLHLGKPNVNGYVVNSDVLVDFYNYTFWDVEYLKADAAGVAGNYQALRDAIESYGGYFCFLGLPLQSTYFAAHYPEYLESRLWHTTAIREAFSTAMTAENVAFLNMYDVFKEMDFPRELYYETDHHFTLKGAFAAYSTLIDHLQAHTDWAFAEYDSSDFSWTVLENPFLGSFNRQLYGLWDTSDAVDLAYFKNDIPFTRTDNGAESAPTIFSLPASSEEYATYSVYMGGDMGETVITTNRSELPNILIYGDSFTNGIETLLWTQANEFRSLDFRYYNEKSLRAYIEEFQPDIVICVRDETVYLSAEGNGITE